MGHIISTSCVITDPDKINAIKNFPVPTNLNHLHAFLGLRNYYRHFSLNYSNVVALLLNLLKKETNWKWGRDEYVIFVKFPTNSYSKFP